MYGNSFKKFGEQSNSKIIPAFMLSKLLLMHNEAYSAEDK